MKARRDKLIELMNNYCNGNYHKFARDLGIDPSHLYRYINTGIGGGTKMIGSVIKFCKRNNLDFEEYIEL